MYNGNVQQNPLCVIPPRFSPTIFDPDANSVLLRAHFFTAVDSMRRKPSVRNCSREREGLYNGNVQQSPLCAASCCAANLRIFRSLSGSRLRFFIAGQMQHPTMHSFRYAPAQQIDAPCRLEADHVRSQYKVEKLVIVLHSTGPLSRM